MAPIGDARGPTRLVVIGGSAGSFDPIGTLIRALPPDGAAAVLVVVHIPEMAGGALHRVLGRGAAAPVSPAVDGAPLVAGQVTVAVAGHHLVVEDGRMRLDAGAPQNGHRPAIDVLFRSAAAWGERAIGVVVSGALADGSDGLRVIVEHGGRALVQDPAEAFMADMPRHALLRAPGARAAPIADLARAVADACRDPAEPSAARWSSGSTDLAVGRAAEPTVARGRGSG